MLIIKVEESLVPTFFISGLLYLILIIINLMQWFYLTFDLQLLKKKKNNWKALEIVISVGDLVPY